MTDNRDRVFSQAKDTKAFVQLITRAAFDDFVGAWHSPDQPPPEGGTRLTAALTPFQATHRNKAWSANILLQ